MAGVGADPNCGFLKFGPGESVTLDFHALQPHTSYGDPPANRATFHYWIRRGASIIETASGETAALTIKGIPVGATRLEYEYSIPLDEARELLELCEQPLIEKTRYKIAVDGLQWEVDEFHGVNEGLVVAECELTSEDQAFTRPDWVGEEVTADPRYFNSNLIANPFTSW